MEEDSENKLARFSNDEFSMEPPENAWDKLDAELTKKREVMYSQKLKRNRLLYLSLALLLIIMVSFYYLIPYKYPGNIQQADDISISTGHRNSNNTWGNKKNETTESLNSNITHSSENADNLISESKKNEAFINKRSNNTEPSGKIENQTGSDKNKVTAKMCVKKQAGSEKQIRKENNSNQENGSDEKDNISKWNSTASPLVINNDIDGNLWGENNAPSELSDSAGNKTIESGKIEENVLVEKSSPGNVSVNDSVTGTAESFLSRISIAAFYAPLLTRNYLKDNNTADAEEADEYTNRETPGYSYSTGLVIGYDISKKWSVFAGCTYSMMSYSIKVSTIYVQYGEDNELHYQYPTSCGNIIMPNPKHYVLHEGDSLKLNAVCGQLLEFINVPIQLRFHTSKNRFTFFADAGITANFVLGEKAKMSIGNYHYIIENNIDGLKKMNYSLLLGLGLQYNFYKGIGVFIEPAFKGSVNSITQNTSVNCFPYSLGLNMGLSFHF